MNEELIDEIMNDMVSVNPDNISPFPYYPLYIRQVLEKHLPSQSQTSIVEKSFEQGYDYYCPECGHKNINNRVCERCDWKIFNL